MMSKSNILIINSKYLKSFEKQSKRIAMMILLYSVKQLPVTWSNKIRFYNIYMYMVHKAIFSKQTK